MCLHLFRDIAVGFSRTAVRGLGKVMRWFGAVALSLPRLSRVRMLLYLLFECLLCSVQQVVECR